MTKQELYLKTMFCCMACDGDIAPEEVELVKAMAIQNPMLKELDVESILNTYISDINQNGAAFLRAYLNELSEGELTQDDELNVIDIALKMIEADSRIEYSEVKFFKKIRVRLSVSDEQILEKHPDKEDFLLPDINVYEDPMWDDVKFENISINLKEFEN